MKFCKKCHKRVLTTERFVDPLSYVFGSSRFCQCNIHVVMGDNGFRAVVQHERRAAVSSRDIKKAANLLGKGFGGN